MKKLILVALLGLVFMFSGCMSRDDDGGYKEIRLQVEDALVLENEKNYTVGDIIYFELKFSRYLKEEGYDTLLDIYETTGAEEFYYSYDLEKHSEFSNSFVRVVLDSSNVTVVKGKSNTSYNGNGHIALLNKSSDLYESRLGIKLVEAGDFRFNFDYLNISGNYEYDRPSLRIQHVFTTSEAVDFEFTVTEQ